jgi:hypothetical protein
MSVTANYISRKQLAKELGERLRGKPYTEMTLIRWGKKGPPSIKIGRTVCYAAASVERWLRAQEGQS